MVGLRLLGPVELVADGRSWDVGGPRQRIVLAALALNANRVTPVEQLIDAVWDTSPPSTARAQIQICVSALRKVFADAGRPDAITTRPPGYLLRLAADELDTEEFAGLVAAARADVAAGRITEAATTLRAALALWRGPALSGVDSAAVRRGAALLEDRRLVALEERLRLDLTLGRHEEITGELRAVLAEHPLHEKLYGLLMLALYRGGRQAEALEVFRDARRTLVDELGVDPGPELRDLERAMLNRDPGLEPRPAEQPVVPRQLPGSVADFTGRALDIEEIKRALTAGATPYAVPIVTISGRGGVGKSSLAIRAAHELREAFPDGHLYADLQPPNGSDRTARLLGRFLRALGVSGAAVPEDVEERAELYRSRLAGKRLLVVLDDASTEDQLVSLLPGSPSCAVIATSRAPLGGLSGAHRVGISVFDVDSSLELLGKIVGAERVLAERAAAEELVSFCDGLPLALRIAGARLAARPHWRIDGLVARLRDEAHRLDELAHHGLELRSNIGLTYRSLSEPAQRLFRLFALLAAPDFPAWTAAALLDTDRYLAEELVETLVEAQLLEAHRGRYRFHDLVRVYAKELLLESESNGERRAALARVLGGWLSLAEQAHRLDHGGDYTILHGRAPRWRAPADVIGNPMDWWEGERRATVAAVRQAAEAGMDELCWDLAHTSVTLFEARGYFDDWRETTELALETVVAAGNRGGEAVMRYSLGTLHLFQKRLDEAHRCLGAALALFEETGNRHGRGLALRNAAYIDGLRGDTGDMHEKYIEALDIMRAVGDRIGEAHILRSLAKHDIDTGDAAGAEALLEESLAICLETRCRRSEAQVLCGFGQLYAHTGRFSEAVDALRRTLRLVRELGDPIGQAYALSELGTVYQRQGRPEAERTLAEARQLSELIGVPIEDR